MTAPPIVTFDSRLAASQASALVPSDTDVAVGVVADGRGAESCRRMRPGRRAGRVGEGIGAEPAARQKVAGRAVGESLVERGVAAAFSALISQSRLL